MARRPRRAIFLLVLGLTLCIVLLQVFWLQSPKIAEEDPKPVEILQEPRLILPQQVAELPKDPNSPRPSTALRIHYKFAYMLENMGFTDPRPKSLEAKAQLDNFFSSVQNFAISKREHAVFVDLWLAFDRFCQRQNFTYVLFFGSLLGAFRHHGMVPWDDDIDLLLPASDMGPLLVLLQEHAELATTEKSTFVHWVFFRDRKKSLPRFGHAWSWPFLELHFYDPTPVGTIPQGFNNCKRANIKNFYPVVRVPFEGHLAPAPRCMDSLILECYPDASRRCCTKNFDHRRGEDLHFGECVPCDFLQESFPFVKGRRRLDRGVFEEELRLNGKLLTQKRVVKNVNC